MTSPSDDDALSWAGDDGAAPQRPIRRLKKTSTTRVGTPHERPAAVSPTVVGTDVDTAGEQPDERSSDAALAEQRPALSTAMLLTLGVVGGVYLLYSAGWVVGGLRLKPLANFFVDDAMLLPWFVLSVVAPALWFLAAWVLTRGKAAWMRVGVLLLGVVLLVPWPFVTVGVVGS